MKYLLVNNFVIVLTCILCSSFGACQRNINGVENNKEEIELIIKVDTSVRSLNKLNINFDSSWSIKKNYKGLSLLGISVLEDNDDLFRENVIVRIFDLNKSITDELIANYIFNEIKKSSKSVIVKDQGVWSSNNLTSYYTVEYSYIHENTNMTSVLFCTINNNKAYIFIFTDITSDFELHFNNSFMPIIQTVIIK